MHRSYMPDYQKVELGLLQLLLVLMGRSGYDDSHYSLFFSYVLLALSGNTNLNHVLVLQTSDRDEKMICYIVNTAEYCHQTVSSFSLAKKQ